MARKASSADTPVETDSAGRREEGARPPRSRIWFTVRLLLVVLAFAAVVKGREEDLDRGVIGTDY